MTAAGIEIMYGNEDGATNEDALEAVKVALEFGVAVNAVSRKGDTVLRGAAGRGQPDRAPPRRAPLARSSAPGLPGASRLALSHVT